MVVLKYLFLKSGSATLYTTRLLLRWRGRCSTIFSLKLQTLDGVEIEHAQRIKAIQNLSQIIPIIEHEEHKYAIER